MKRSEVTKCALCEEGLMSKNNMTHYKIKIERYVFDIDEIQRCQGMEMMLGSPSIANVFSGDPDISDKASESDGFICEDCACTYRTCIAELAERIQKEKEDES